MTRPNETQGNGRNAYVLAGDVAGTSRRFLLGPGLNPVGSLSSNAVLLRAPGISKRHAVVSVAGDRLSVKDLASKNGTFVNDTRVENRTIQPGDRLGFGKTTLRLVELDARDTELAIGLGGESLRPLRPKSSSVPTTSLPALPSGRLPHDDLEAVEELLARLLSPAPGAQEAALARLARAVGGQGACLLGLRESASPVVLSCHGNLDVVELTDLALMGPSERDAPLAVHRLEKSAGPALTIAVDASSTDSRMAVAVWGDRYVAPAHDAMLRIVLRVLTHGREGWAEPPAKKTPARSACLSFPADHVRGESAVMRSLYRQMQAVALSDLPILILGETGVGKEGIARILHASSKRRDGPFVAVDCAAIPSELLEAELFGIAQGVATGVDQRRGRFHQAQRGTMFLDEIGDMPSSLQAKLLRVLQEKEVHPVGGKPVVVDSRILAATNTDLEQRVEKGAFRSDLYYRLAGFVLRVPPLAERKEDVPALVEHFLQTYSARAEKEIPGMTALALSRLTGRRWPGNVRELEHEVWRLVCLCPEGQPIDSLLVQPSASGSETKTDRPPREAPAGLDATSSRADSAGPAPLGIDSAEDLDLRTLESLELESVERAMIEEALRRCGWNRSRAARLLGISREALRRRIARHQLIPPG